MADEKDQSVKPLTTALVGRNPDGTFAAGNPGNPGVADKLKGRQPFARRVDRFMSMSLNEIKTLLEKGDHLGQLSGWDAAAADAAMALFDVNEERKVRLKVLNELLNRCEGTPVQTIQTTNVAPITAADLENTTPEQAQAAYEALVKET